MGRGRAIEDLLLLLHVVIYVCTYGILVCIWYIVNEGYCWCALSTLKYKLQKLQTLCRNLQMVSLSQT